MTIEPDVLAVARYFGLDPALLQAVVNAEGDIVKAVRCSVAGVTERADALKITARSCVHALCDYVKLGGAASQTDFVTFWGERWAPVGAKNDPTNLNANWSRNVSRLWTSIAVLLLAVCVGCRPVPRPQPMPPAPVGCVAVAISDANGGGPLDGAAVTIGGLTARTGDQRDPSSGLVLRGYHIFSPTAVGPVTIHVEMAGYVPVDHPYTAPVAAPGACDVPIALVPIFTPLPALHAEGEFFKTETGERWLGIGTTDFLLWARMLTGDEEGAERVMVQRHDLGYNEVRIFTRFCNIPGIGETAPRSNQWIPAGCITLEKYPGLYEQFPAFAKLAATHGLYVNVTAFIGPNNEDDPRHWGWMCSAAQQAQRESHNIFLSLVNENDVHPIDLSPYHPCAGVLSSRGSNGSQAWPPNDDIWQWGEFHTNGAPEWFRKSGHNGWEIAEAYHIPIDNDENTSADADQTAAHFEDAGAGIALFIAAGTFHSQQGKDSVLFTGGTLERAQAFVRGMKKVPLRCRELGYERLDPGAFLRVYRRGGDEACRVEIRP